MSKAKKKTKKKEKTYTLRDIEYMLCGGGPYEEGIDNKEKAKRLRKYADLLEKKIQGAAKVSRTSTVWFGKD